MKKKPIMFFVVLCLHVAICSPDFDLCIHSFDLFKQKMAALVSEVVNQAQGQQQQPHQSSQSPNKTKPPDSPGTSVLITANVVEKLKDLKLMKIKKSAPIPPPKITATITLREGSDYVISLVKGSSKTSVIEAWLTDTDDGTASYSLQAVSPVPPYTSAAAAGKWRTEILLKSMAKFDKNWKGLKRL